MKTPIPRCLPWSYCTYKNNCVWECARACVCVCVLRKTEESRRWDENGGHNGRMENKNTSICISCAGAPVFTVLCWPHTLRGALLHCHICWVGLFFSLPSEAAASLSPVRLSQDVHTNTANKQKLSLNSDCNQRALCAHSDVPLRAPGKECAAGLLYRPERQKETQRISLQMLCQMLQRGN